MTPNSDEQKYVKREWELINKEIQVIFKMKINDNKLKENLLDESDWLELKIDPQTIGDLEMELHLRESHREINPNPFGEGGVVK